MAKKTVATLQSGASKKMTKLIRVVKSPKTGAYHFDEKIVTADEVNDLLK